MPQKINWRRPPVWRKTVTLFLLPVIILLWMTGWILTKVGSSCMSAEIRPKADIIYPRFQANEKSETAKEDEDSRIAYKPEIIA
jgi:hypothetical protein